MAPSCSSLCSCQYRRTSPRHTYHCVEPPPTTHGPLWLAAGITAVSSSRASCHLSALHSHIIRRPTRGASWSNSSWQHTVDKGATWVLTHSNSTWSQSCRCQPAAATAAGGTATRRTAIKAELEKEAAFAAVLSCPRPERSHSSCSNPPLPLKSFRLVEKSVQHFTPKKRTMLQDLRFVLCCREEATKECVTFTLEFSLQRSMLVCV